MAGTVVIFDFDRTIIDGDSDNWVVTEMGLTQLFNHLRSTLTWNSLMDRMMMELHSQGKTSSDIAECLKRAYMHPQVIAAIKSAYALGCDLRIISDANQFFIEKILEHHGVLGCFSHICTNPIFVDEEGRLRILPHHDLNLPPHGCNLCPSNLCKGVVIDQIKECASKSGRRNYIYIGDGSGDYCPTLKLEKGDFVMPRKNFRLWERIHSKPSLIRAEVHGWSNGEDLEKVLLYLIDKISTNQEVTSDEL